MSSKAISGQVWLSKWGVLQLGRRQAGGCCRGPLHRLCAAPFQAVFSDQSTASTCPDLLWLLLQLPIGSEDTFAGVIDLVQMKAIIWDGEVSLDLEACC